MKTWTKLACFLAIIPGSAAPATAGLTVFANYPTGSVPETMSPIPASFSSSGGFLVPDPGPFVINPSAASNIWYLPQDGGTPTLFTTVSGGETVGGLFLPAGFSTYGGDYLAVGLQTVYAVNSSGGVATIASSTSYTGLSTPVIAPAGFGAQAGNVLISSQTGTSSNGIVELSATTGQLTTFVPSVTNINRPFGMVFAPTTFGAVGGELLVNDSRSGTIDAISSSGPFRRSRRSP